MAKDQKTMSDDPEARRLRQLRRAEGFGKSKAAFAKKLGWTQPEISMFESGERQVPRAKVLKLHEKIPGFDPLWFTEGRLEGLSFDLRQRLLSAAEEATDSPIGQQSKA